MNKVTWIAAVGLMAFATMVNGQVIEMSTVQDDGETMQFMTFSTEDGFNMESGPALMMPSPMGNGFSFGSDQFSLLGRPNVQQELNLVDEQVQRLQEVRKNFRDRMKDMTTQMRNNNGDFRLDPDMIKKLQELTKEINEQKRDEIEGLLLPEQIERLKQIALQSTMKHQGTVNALSNRDVAEALGLDEEQIANLREKSKEISQRVQEEIKALREKAREDLLDELTDEQREKLSDLMGEKFENDDRSPIREVVPRRKKD